MTSILRHYLGPIAVKVTGVLLALAVLTTLAIGTAVTMFSGISKDLDAFSRDQVPAMAAASHLMALSSQAEKGLQSLLMAPGPADIDASKTRLRQHISELEQVVYGANLNDTALLEAPAKLFEDVSQLAAARTSELQQQTRIDRRVQDIAQEIAAIEAAMETEWAAAFGTLRAPEGVQDQKTKAVQKLQSASSLAQILGAYQTAANSAAISADLTDVAAAQASADEAAEILHLIALSFPENNALHTGLTALMARSGTDQSIFALRRDLISLRRGAQQAATQAIATMTGIAAIAQTSGTTVQQQIATASDLQLQRAERAQLAMWWIAGGVLVILCLAPFAMIHYVVRPIGQITRITTRLASGDTAEVPGFDQHGGEIARLGQALAVFRQNLLERVKMHQLEQKRQTEEQQRLLSDAQAKQAQERREREQEIALERAKHAQEEKTRQERESLRAEADAERARQQAEQDLVVGELARGLQALAEGDLTQSITAVFPDSYEGLRKNFNQALIRLADLITRIATTTGQIQGNSQEISAAALDLSNRTESSASTLVETAASLDTLTKSVELAAEGARQADALSRTTNGKAENSRVIVQDAIKAMSQIEDSADQIGKIIDVIDEIAFQTNILALNAGVEAARAGEAGRGFAVVASEVRALAQRSSGAAREINGLISNSTDLIRDGARLVDNTGNALQDIIDAVGEIATNMTAISTSAQKQAAGIKEINSATSKLENTMQQNAAMTEETTAASRLLSVTANELQAVAQAFRTPSETGEDGEAPSAEAHAA